MFFPETYKTRDVVNGIAADSTSFNGLVPTAGVSTVTLIAIIGKAADVDVVLTVQTAEPVLGAVAVDITENIPIWKDGTRLADSKVITADLNGVTYVYEFQIPCKLIPTGYAVGLTASAGGNPANILSILMVEELYHRGQ